MSENPFPEPMTVNELAIFKQLTDIQVVFDVGARTSLEYLALAPHATFHLFEPHPPFYEWLKEQCKDKPNVHVNGYGLGDVIGEMPYDIEVQAFAGGAADARKMPVEYPIKTLDWYIEENKIDRIDFLKIDAEGYDIKILRGGVKAIQLARYIQYEYWNNKQEFHDILEDKFVMSYIGERNVFCSRKV